MKLLLIISLSFAVNLSLFAQEGEDLFYEDYSTEREEDLRGVLAELDELIILKASNKKEKYLQKLDDLAEDFNFRAIDYSERETIEREVYEIMKRLRILKEPVLEENFLSIVLYSYKSKNKYFLPITLHKALHFILVERQADGNYEILSKTEAVTNLFKNFSDIPGAEIILEKTLGQMRKDIYELNVVQRITELSLAANYQNTATANFLMARLLHINEKFYSSRVRDDFLESIARLMPYTPENGEILKLFFSQLQARFRPSELKKDTWHFQNKEWTKAESAFLINWREAHRLEKTSNKIPWSDFIESFETHRANSLSEFSCKKSAG